jgi:hypothetical protein
MLTEFGQNHEIKANSKHSIMIVLKEVNNLIQLCPRKNKEIDLSLENKIHHHLMPKRTNVKCSELILFITYFPYL